MEEQGFPSSYAWLLPDPLSPVSKLDRRHSGRLRKRGNLLTEEGGRVRAMNQII
jgi:hypothetical protein